MITTPPTLVDLDSNEWYTPPTLLAPVRELWGEIDMDPASCDEAQKVVQATTFYTKATDGLAQEWWGRVFLNPPYGDPLPWITKLTRHYQTGQVSEALLLVNTVNSPQWSRPL